MAADPPSKTRVANDQPAPPRPEQQEDGGDLDKKLGGSAAQDPLSGSELGEVVSGSGAVNERALLRKIDWQLLPAVGVLYLLSFLDRSNVGNARIEGLADDLHMTGNQYLTGLTLYFVGYVIFEESTRC